MQFEIYEQECYGVRFPDAITPICPFWYFERTVLMNGLGSACVVRPERL